MLLFSSKFYDMQIDVLMKKIKVKNLMTAAEIDLVLARITAEILEKLGQEEDFAVIGIRRREIGRAHV